MEIDKKLFLFSVMNQCIFHLLALRKMHENLSVPLVTANKSHMHTPDVTLSHSEIYLNPLVTSGSHLEQKSLTFSNCIMSNHALQMNNCCSISILKFISIHL